MHGDSMISICMLKLFDESICKRLNITSTSCSTQDISPSESKKTNAVCSSNT